MDYLANDDNSVLQRKYSNRLKMAGRAIIIFGLWSSLRVLILYFLNQESFLTLVYEALKEALKEEGLDNSYIYPLLIVLAIVLVGIPFLINLYMGLSAMGEAKGKKKTPVYLVICVLSFIVSLVSIFMSDLSDYLELAIAALIVDITFCIACIDVVYSAIRLRRCKRQAKKEV